MEDANMALFHYIVSFFCYFGCSQWFLPSNLELFCYLFFFALTREFAHDCWTKKSELCFHCFQFSLKLLAYSSVRIGNCNIFYSSLVRQRLVCVNEIKLKFLALSPLCVRQKKKRMLIIGTKNYVKIYLRKKKPFSSPFTDIRHHLRLLVKRWKEGFLGLHIECIAILLLHVLLLRPMVHSSLKFQVTFSFFSPLLTRLFQQMA